MEERIINEEIDEITELKTLVDAAIKQTVPIVVRNDISIIPENVRMWHEFNCKLGFFKDMFREQGLVKLRASFKKVKFRKEV